MKGQIAFLAIVGIAAAAYWFWPRDRYGTIEEQRVCAEAGAALSRNASRDLTRHFAD